MYTIKYMKCILNYIKVINQRFVLSVLKIGENKVMFKEHGICPMLTLTLFKILPSKYNLGHHLDPSESRDVTVVIT